MKNDKKQEYRVNEQIHAREVRLIIEGGEALVLPTYQALAKAHDAGVDLVEISPNAQPPVCRLIDYSKFLYQLKKHQKELKAKQIKIEVKEIRFGPQTDEHDYNFKLKHAQEFLNEGNKVKAYVFFKGRSILFKEQGEVLLLRFANDLEEYGKVEQMPVLDGKRMFLYLAPKKLGVVKKSQQAVDREKSAVLSKTDGVASNKDNSNKKDNITQVVPNVGNGLFANAKISDETKEKLSKSE
jgi:translation initiation factor IF-3